MDCRRAQRVKRELHRLCHRGLDPLAFTRSARDLLQQAVPYDASCWLTIDPATMLFTGGLFDYPPEMAPRLAWNELLEEDVNKIAEVARRPVPVGVLSAATDGHPERSRRYRDILRPAGLQAELRGAFTADSATWGAAVLYREPHSPEFDAEEANFVAEVSTLLAEGFRTSLIAADVLVERPGGQGPGLILLAEDGSVETMTPEAARWVEELDHRDSVREGDRPLPAILQVAYRARAIAAGTASVDHAGASLRVLTRSGRWLRVHASVLEGPFAGRTAVILEPARPAEIAPLIVEAYGLSQRERQIAQLVLQGASTAEMAALLYVSPFTVQDHLKAIFEKMGVNSRREVASRIFFDHHFPPVVTTDVGSRRSVWQARSLVN